MARGKKGGGKPPVRGLVVDPKKEREPELDERERLAIMRYSGAHLAAWHERVLDIMPTRELERIETPVVDVQYRQTSVNEAWYRLNVLLLERSKGKVHAYLAGLLDRPPGAKGWGAGAVVGGLALIVAGPIVAVPAAVAVTVADSLRKTRKLMSPGGPSGLPDLPEFKNDWALQSFRFVQQVIGYQTRVAAVERLRHFRLMPRTAEWYARLLFGARARLDANLAVLIQLQPVVHRGKRSRVRPEDVLASDEQNRLLRQMLPNWDPDLDWLPLEDGIIQPGEEFDRLRADLLLLESLQEAAAEARRDERREEWAKAEEAAAAAESAEADPDEAAAGNAPAEDDGKDEED